MPSHYSEAFEKLHKYNICIFAGIIFGLEDDTEESIIQRTQYLLEQSIDCYWSPVLTPLPGTRLFERLKKENRLLFTNFPADWSKYTYSNPVFTPKNIEYHAYIKAVRNAYNTLYSFKNIKNKYKQSLTLTSNRDLAHIGFKTNLDSARLFQL